jgi:hypothetical protein
MGSVGADIDAVVAGRTVPSLFVDTVAARPDAVALRWRPPGSDAATESLTGWRPGCPASASGGATASCS